jgi:hypothetical protein
MPSGLVHYKNRTATSTVNRGDPLDSRSGVATSVPQTAQTARILVAGSPGRLRWTREKRNHLGVLSARKARAERDRCDIPAPCDTRKQTTSVVGGRRSRRRLIYGSSIGFGAWQRAMKSSSHLARRSALPFSPCLSPFDLRMSFFLTGSTGGGDTHLLIKESSFTGDRVRTKWQWMIAVISSVQLVLGVMGLVKYSHSVGATGDATGACVYLALGISGVLVLVLPALGSVVAIMQGGVALYALCWFPIGIALLRTPVFPASALGAWAPIAGVLFLALAGQTAVLCSLGAVATWGGARQSKRRY